MSTDTPPVVLTIAGTDSGGAAGLAHGRDLRSATLRAQAFVSHALETSRSWHLGRGHGSVAHTFAHPDSSHPTKEI